MLLSDLLEEYIYSIQVRNYSHRTIKGYRNNNLAFFRFIKADFDIDEIDEVRPHHIKAYFMHLKQIGRKATYVNGILKNIRSFFNYCVEEGYIAKKRNPCEGVDWMKEERTVIHTFNDTEIGKMIQSFPRNSYMNMRNRLILMVFADTGIRSSELIDIKENDVLETNLRISGKGGKQRYVPLSPILKKNMIRYQRMKDLYFKDKLVPHSNYFISYRGLPLTPEALQRVVRIAGERAKVRKSIRCSPHTIRHYYAQKQLRLGMDVYSLSRLLGHSTIDITRVYLESLQDEKIVEKGRMFSPLMNLNKK